MPDAAVIQGVPAGLVDLKIPTGEELYNFLMKDIEPDLLTSQLPLLDERYKNESPEAAAARAARYEKAFAEYEKRLSAYMAELNAKVREYQRTAMQSIEHEERAEEEQKLSGLEQQMGIV
jgi:hypothetical protein